MHWVRRVMTALVFALGLVGSIATSGPAADVSGISDEKSVALNADHPGESFQARARLTAPGATTTEGEVGLNVVVEGSADASLIYTLRSETTGEESSGDIVDTQAQGSARIGIAAFQGCSEACIDDFTIEFARSDINLEGDLVVNFNLDALASTETEASGEIELSIQ